MQRRVRQHQLRHQQLRDVRQGLFVRADLQRRQLSVPGWAYGMHGRLRRPRFRWEELRSLRHDVQRRDPVLLGLEVRCHLSWRAGRVRHGLQGLEFVPDRPPNCGMCGMACSGGGSCTAGKCGCATGQMLCGTTCADTQTSAANCGMCGMACASGQTCTAGKCGTGGSMTDGGGGGLPRPTGCPAATALLSDFEEGSGVLVNQGGRTGWRYLFSDTSAGTQTPATSTSAIAAALLDPPGGTCNKYAMHSTAANHPMYVGFGATFAPGATAAGKKPVSLAEYTGISFKIKIRLGHRSPHLVRVLEQGVRSRAPIARIAEAAT